MVVVVFASVVVPGSTNAFDLKEMVIVTPPTFYVVSYGGKCLDFGAPPQVTGGPVFIYGCNGTIAQQVQVQEINDRHEVILRAGTKVIGAKPSTVMAPIGKGGRSAPLFTTFPGPLELQDDQTGPAGPASHQVFALDGDSIILAADRTRVVKVQNNRGANRTPLVLGPRDLADNEFWTFQAVDKSGRYSTTGFVRVPQAGVALTPNTQFLNALKNAPWGTVIDVDPGAMIDLTRVSLPIPAGVTIRSNRRSTNFGGELHTSSDGTMLEIAGNDVRLTGLRLRGPSRSKDKTFPIATGISAPDAYLSIIDHNDLSDWTDQAILIRGSWTQNVEQNPPELSCDRRDRRDWPSDRQPNVRIARNFIHHNEMEELGYGVKTGEDGYPLIEGNLFYLNRHAISADATALNGYLAWYNLVLSDAPAYHVCCVYEQDFDMHGSDPKGHHTGGIGGGVIEIAGNTFLGTNRRNFDLRGRSCARDQFHHNVSLQNKNDAIRWVVQGSYSNQASPPQAPPPWLDIPVNNQFGVRPNPTDHLGVGDFDGDGADDVFLATGAAWYYAPQANAEWRFLNAQPDPIGNLLFGDFDGDGLTDVFTQHGFDWVVSWAGASPWEKINGYNQLPMSEYAIGDFNGDHLADVFYADGKQWYISYGGNTPFTPAAGSSFRAHDLGFGDFNGDGKTDVVAATSGQWMVSLSATGPWAGWPLRPALTNTMAGLIIADFNGNGRADIATRDGKVSYDGRGDWRPLRTNPGVAAIGRFDNRPGTDVLYWDSRSLRIISSGVGPDQQQSRQDMR